MAYNQRQLNNGQQGSGSGLDADKFDGDEVPDIDVTNFTGFPIGSSNISLASTELTDSNNIDAFSVQGNEPSDLGNTIDGITITENEKGNIQSTKFIKTIGDFESNQGEWNFTKGDLNILERRSENPAENGQYYVFFNTYQITGSGYIERDLDLTSFGILRFFVRQDNATDDGTHPFRLKINGNTEYQRSSSETTGFREIEVDISNYTGIQSLKFEAEGDGGSSGSSYSLDYIQLESKNPVIKFENDGEGGSV